MHHKVGACAGLLAAALAGAPAAALQGGAVRPSQDRPFTVNAASADVHADPHVGSAVLGQAARGAVLTATQELGKWVQISWPGSPNGVGYVRVTTGTIGRAPSTSAHRLPADENRSVSLTPNSVRADVDRVALRLQRWTTAAEACEQPTTTSPRAAADRPATGPDCGVTDDRK